MTTDRRQQALRTRVEAAEKARQREHPDHDANGDEQRFASAAYAMSFSKGLAHSPSTGLVEEVAAFESFRRAIDEGFVDAFTTRVRVSRDKERKWEAPTAGVVYELEGPDPQAVTMPPAPALGSDELAYEMAEVYELALLRDVELSELREGTTDANVLGSRDRLNALPYDISGASGRPRKGANGAVTAKTLFRGSSPGVDVGPYLSQFMLIGNDQPTNTGLDHGRIQYGALQIDQRVPVAVPKDYMTEWSDWLDAQNGKNLRCNEELFGEDPARRFITTPRDLATYVHDDALYEAYLNACLILLSMEAPFDPAFAALSGDGDLFFNSLDLKGQTGLETHARQAGGFALYGGPHILTLVCEVATRALKAVRFQKFNNHLRLRPEALAGRIQCAGQIEEDHPSVGTGFSDLACAIDDTVQKIRALNGQKGSATALLPMAFQEGSPMHPSYGAGHATVAGACVTILKAFFDTGAVFVEGDVETKKGIVKKELFRRFQVNDKDEKKAKDKPIHYVVVDGGNALQRIDDGPVLTLEGELNKLAANISIGRNMAGVHYFSDYYDSLRMGEEIAIGVLEEQALCYPTDPFVLTLPTFDGGERRIGRR